MTFGLEDVATTIEAQIVLSAAVALLAFGSAYVVRRARVALSDRIAEENHVLPVAVDVVGAGLSIGIVVVAALAVADVWGQTQTLTDQFGGLGVEERAAQIAITVVVLIAIQVFGSIARRLLDDITRESNAVSEHERELTYRLVQLTLWTIGIVVVLGVWEVNLGGLLIGAGFLGIVLGLAAQQTLGSLLAGLVLMFSRPFEVGDWIAVGEDEGIVTDITVMNTVIQAFDGEYVVVPNDVISSQTVKNRSRKGRLRIEVDVGVDYTADVDRARDLATDAISGLDIVMDVPRPETVTKTFGDSSVTLGVRGWIEHPSSRRRWRARTQMIRSVKAAFAESGIKIPFPQRELSGRQEEDGLRITDGRRAADARDGEQPVGESTAAVPDDGEPGVTPEGGEPEATADADDPSAATEGADATGAGTDRSADEASDASTDSSSADGQVDVSREGFEPPTSGGDDE